MCMPQAIENAARRLKEMKAFKDAWTGKTSEARLALSVNTTPIEPARLVYAEKTEKMKGLELKRVGWRLHSEDVEIGKTGITAGLTSSRVDPSNDPFGSSNAAQISQAMAQQIGEVAAKMIEKNMNVAPTLKIRPGYRFNVMAVKDLTFDKPYRAFDYR